MHIYIYTYIRIYVYTYIHIYIYTYIHIYIYTYIYTNLYSYLNTYIHTYIYIHMHICIHAFVYIYTYIYTVYIDVFGLKIMWVFGGAPSSDSKHENNNSRIVPSQTVCFFAESLSHCCSPSQTRNFRSGLCNLLGAHVDLSAESIHSYGQKCCDQDQWWTYIYII